MKNYSLKEILDSLIAKSLINTIFNGREIEILTRPGSHILKLKVEPEEKVTRVIILPPKGFTSNDLTKAIKNYQEDVIFSGNLEKTKENLRNNLKVGDCLLLLGAGDIYKIGKEVLDKEIQV